MYFFIFIGVIIFYFGIRVWIGSRKMEFYGDSIKKNSSNARVKRIKNQPSMLHS